MQFSWLKRFQVSLLTLKLLTILIYHLIYSSWLLNHLLSSVLQPFSLLLLFLIFTWLTNSCSKFKFSGKAKTTLRYTFFKMGVVKPFSYGQTVTYKPNLFDFDIPKHKKCFDYPWRIWPLSIVNFFGKFWLHNGKMCLANVQKDAGPSKLGYIWEYYGGI